MSQELIYTSAPRGLFPGSHGFCTVAASQSLSRSWREALERLSGLRSGRSATAARSSHLIMRVGGTTRSVLSRVADAGLDYSDRSNILARHLVLAPDERPAAGPAWALESSDLIPPGWDGKVGFLGDRAIPRADAPPSPCTAWARVTGDAGWAGSLIEYFLQDRKVWIVAPPTVDLLALMAEAVALLPPERRWDVAFSTEPLSLPPGVVCHWTGSEAGSRDAKTLTTTQQQLVLDLGRRLGPAMNRFAAFARDGQMVQIRDEFAATLPPPVLINDDNPDEDWPDPDPPDLFADGPAAPLTPASPGRRNPVRLRIVAVLGVVAAVALFGGLAAALILLPRPTPEAVAQADPEKPKDKGEPKPKIELKTEPPPAANGQADNVKKAEQKGVVDTKVKDNSAESKMSNPPPDQGKGKENNAAPPPQVSLNPAEKPATSEVRQPQTKIVWAGQDVGKSLKAPGKAPVKILLPDHMESSDVSLSLLALPKSGTADDPFAKDLKKDDDRFVLQANLKLQEKAKEGEAELSDRELADWLSFRQTDRTLEINVVQDALQRDPPWSHLDRLVIKAADRRGNTTYVMLRDQVVIKTERSVGSNAIGLSHEFKGNFYMPKNARAFHVGIVYCDYATDKKVGTERINEIKENGVTINYSKKEKHNDTNGKDQGKLIEHTMKLNFKVTGNKADLLVNNAPEWFHIQRLEICEKLSDGFWIPMVVFQDKPAGGSK